MRSIPSLFKRYLKFDLKNSIIIHDQFLSLAKYQDSETALWKDRISVLDVHNHYRNETFRQR